HYIRAEAGRFADARDGAQGIERDGERIDGAAGFTTGTGLYRTGIVRSAGGGAAAGGSARAEFEWRPAADCIPAGDGAVPQQYRRKERLGGKNWRARAAK